MIRIYPEKTFISLSELGRLDDNAIVSVSRQAISFRKSELVHLNSYESLLLLIELNRETSLMVNSNRSRNSIRFRMSAYQAKRIFKEAHHIPQNAFCIMA